LNYNNFISIRNLSVSYEKFGSRIQALHNISLDIGQGQRIVILGANGSGKSTLLKAISRQLTVDSGIIEIGGGNIDRMKIRELTRIVFYVNQNPLMGSIPQLTVWENLIATDLPMTKRKNSAEFYSTLLQEVALDFHKNHLVQYLSGGQRQILTLLIAKMRNPRILLLDEPLASLDPENTKIALNIIDELHRAGTTVLEVVHDLKNINGTNSKTIILEKGQLIDYE
jgi:putative ABC transport system ATP-binding protein